MLALSTFTSELVQFKLEYLIKSLWFENPKNVVGIVRSKLLDESVSGICTVS